jgi:hypothetical protein
MAIGSGAAVELLDQSTSMAGGKAKVLAAGLVGRVCRISPAGFCCVQFVGMGCRRVHRDRLRRTEAAAPLCSSKCTQGC